MVTATILQKIYEAMMGVWNILMGLSEWFTGLVNKLNDLYGYFTGNYTDAQTRAYAEARNEKGELVRPELAGKSPAEIREEMPTFMKTIQELPGNIVDKAKNYVNTPPEPGEGEPPLRLPTTESKEPGTALPGSSQYSARTDVEAQQNQQGEDRPGIGQITNFLGGLLPRYDKGGFVPQTGPAILHAGEYVLPPGSNSESNTKNVYIDLGGFTFNITGGGDIANDFALRKTIEDIVTDAIRHSQSA